MEARDLIFPDWQLQYFDALAEGSPETLRERVDDAERAILVRLAQLVSRPEREMEQLALRDTLAPDQQTLSAENRAGQAPRFCLTACQRIP